MKQALMPWAAFLLLFVVDHLASRAGVPQSGPPAQRGGDIQDTHQRLEAIYRRLGIKRAPPIQERHYRGCQSRGCGCQDDRPEPESAKPMARVPAMPPMLGYLMIGAVILAMLVPLYLSLRRSYQSSSQAPPGVDEDDAVGAPAPQRGPWLVHLADCRALLEAGKLSEAFAALHRAFLISLAEQRYLVLGPNTTNWEYVRFLSSRPQLRQALAAVTAAAESSVLGRRPPTRDHYLVLEQQVIAATRHLEGAQ